MIITTKKPKTMTMTVMMTRTAPTKMTESTAPTAILKAMKTPILGGTRTAKSLKANLKRWSRNLLKAAIWMPCRSPLTICRWALIPLHCQLNLYKCQTQI